MSYHVRLAAAIALLFRLRVTATAVVFEDGRYGHYAAWRAQRFAVMEIVMPLRDVSIFEAGGGHCWFSQQYEKLGNRVLCSERREENIKRGREHAAQVPVRLRPRAASLSRSLSIPRTTRTRSTTASHIRALMRLMGHEPKAFRM